MAEGRQARSSVLIVAVAEYADATKNRQAVADAATAFASLFDDSSHATIHAPLIGGPKSDEILASLRAWGGDRSASTGLLLWTGHCELADATDEPQLLGGGPGGDIVDASTLANQIANRLFERWVIVVDACYAYRVGAMVAEKLKQVVGRMSGVFAVLCAVDALGEAEAGVLTAALAAVLRDGPDQRWWSRRQQFLKFDEVLKRLEQYLREHHPGYEHELMQHIGGRCVRECFPNPLYVETGVAEALDEAHFLPKAKGVEAGESGWFFTGRVHALRRICSWLRRADDPLLVVTGSAGTGKSAILGRVITLSVPAYRRQAEAAGVLAHAAEGTVPDPGDVQLAFHAREQEVGDLLRFLAEHLEAPTAREVTDLYAPVGARARARPHGLTIARRHPRHRHRLLGPNRARLGRPVDDGPVRRPRARRGQVGRGRPRRRGDRRRLVGPGGRRAAPAPRPAVDLTAGAVELSTGAADRPERYAVSWLLSGYDQEGQPMSSPAQAARHTYDDLASFPDDGLRRELIGGELVVSPAPRLRHQRVVAEFTTEFTLHTRAHGGTVFPAPTDVYFTDEDVVEPDVLFVRPEHSDRLEEKLVRSAPDIVVEVSSPSTRRLDLGRKRELYERHGVPEYWYADLEHDRMRVYRLTDGRYGEPETLTRGDKLTSPLLPGFAVTVEDVLHP